MRTGLMNYKARMYDPAIGRFYAMDPMGQTPSFYNYCGNNPISFTDPSGEIFGFDDLAVAYFIGHWIGVYTGYQIGKEAGADGWGLLAYSIGGGLIGGYSALAGASIAASEIPFAGTLGLATGSTMNSLGMNVLSGGKNDISSSIGFGAMNWSKGRFDYLGKEGNSTSENFGFLFGGMQNLSDYIAGFDGGMIDVNAAEASKYDWWSHSSITSPDEQVNISIGPNGGDGSIPVTKPTFIRYFDVIDGQGNNNNYYGEPGTWSTKLNNINKSILKEITKKTQNGQGMFWGN
ncbi:MAG: RHS repeat-associated core domain-containing protein [Bacteroidetes bacterium]|nr:RHS repeat-associated core domain-containing protein [Bacteroidota bacterium]